MTKYQQKEAFHRVPELPLRSPNQVQIQGKCMYCSTGIIITTVKLATIRTDSGNKINQIKIDANDIKKITWPGT